MHEEAFRGSQRPAHEGRKEGNDCTSLPRRPFDVVGDRPTKAERKGMTTHELAEEAFALSAEGLHEASVRRIV